MLKVIKKSHQPASPFGRCVGPAAATDRMGLQRGGSPSVRCRDRAASVVRARTAAGTVAGLGRRLEERDLQAGAARLVDIGATAYGRESDTLAGPTWNGGIRARVAHRPPWLPFFSSTPKKKTLATSALVSSKTSFCFFPRSHSHRQKYQVSMLDQAFFFSFLRPYATIFSLR